MKRVLMIAAATAMVCVTTAADPNPAPPNAATPDGAPTAAASPTPLPLTQLQIERKHHHGIDPNIRMRPGRAIDFKSAVLDGPDFQLSRYRGRVVIINVFATWCGPCAREQPELSAFAAAHTDDTTVVGIDDDDTDDQVRSYRKHFAITYPIAMDRRQMLVWQFYTGNRMYPATIVIRPNGTVSCAWVNGVDREWLENERLIALST